MALPADANPLPGPVPPAAAPPPTHGILRCDRCQVALPDAVFNTPDPVACPSCHESLLARVFPAFYRPPAAATTAETVGSDEDASCFYHPRKKAVVPCARCGRFLCALCDLALDGLHLCPGCATAPRPSPGAGTEAAAGAAVLPLRRRVLYDKVALLVALLPLLVWPFTLVTAPVALFLALRHWNDARRSPLPRTRVRVILAALVALLQIAGWIALAVYTWTSHPQSGPGGL